MHIEYETPVDSIEDALQTQKQIFAPSDFAFARDQRTRVKELAKRITPYDLVYGDNPLWIVEG